MLSDGGDLVFLVSQPRSGSTLLQRMLGRHPQIHTTSEPWIMLHPLQALHKGAFTADHDAEYAHLALTDFLSSFPDGLRAYYEAVGRFASHLYDRALSDSGATLFLDKTPRYYLILNELAQVFPKARFLLLVRNPAAVISSVYTTWVKPNPLRIRKFTADLLAAPPAILRARNSLGDRALWVPYETLVLSETETCSRIYEFLNLSPDEGGTETELPTFALGDSVNVYQYREPQTEFKDRWKDGLGDPQIWRWVRDYIVMLGDDTVSDLGYDPREISDALEHRRRLHRHFTVPLAAVLRPH